MTTLKTGDAKDLRISLLRITATLAIVWLHTNGTTVVHPEIIEVDEAHARWFVVNYYLMRWGVPIFLMITGALMLNRKKELTPDECIFKYARRIFFAVLLFGSAYSFVLGAGTDTIIGSLLKAPWHAVSGGTATHLWYCFMLIGVYLILPVLKTFVDHAPRRWVFTVLVCIFIFGMVIPTINRVFALHIEFSIAVTYPVFYILCGYYMDRYRTDRCRPLYLIGLPVLLLATGIAACLDPTLDAARFDYMSPVPALEAVCIFGLFFGNENTPAVLRTVSPSLKKRLWQIDRLCFGVYLIHPIFIQGFYRILKFTPMHMGAYRLGTVLIFLIVSLLSFLACAVLRLIPPMRKYVL